MFNAASIIKNSSTGQINQDLLRFAIRLNVILLAIVFGLVSGLSILFATFLSLKMGGDQPGYYLKLLAVFLPGYTVTFSGAWIGFFWGFVFGGISGALTFWTYAHILREKIAGLVYESDHSDFVLHPPILRIAGHPLGLALGFLMALQLLITTNWLVIRGTADKSIHAALLSNYLPGYTVSFMGSIIGAIQLFALTYLFCLLIGYVYNRIVSLRHGD